jgi:hypothetical protein
MGRLLIKASLALTITTIVVLGADHSLGCWKLNVQKSKYTPEPFPIKSLATVRGASDGGVTVTTSGERADGTKIITSYTAKYDGSVATVTGEGVRYDSISIKQVNANKLTDDRKKTGGSYQATGQTVISKRGKSLTVTTKGTNTDGKEFTSTLVFDRQ